MGPWEQDGQIIEADGKPVECEPCPCEGACPCCNSALLAHPTLDVAVTIGGVTYDLVISTDYTTGTGCDWGGWFGTGLGGVSPVTSGTWSGHGADTSFFFLFTPSGDGCSFLGLTHLATSPSGVTTALTTLDADDCNTFPKTFTGTLDGVPLTIVVSVPMEAMVGDLASAAQAPAQRSNICPKCGAPMTKLVPCPPPAKCKRKVCPNCA